jgi:hypothetical protein
MVQEKCRLLSSEQVAPGHWVLQMSRRLTEMVNANATAVEQRMEHLQQAHEKTRHIVDTVIAGGSLSDCNLQV